MNEITKASRGFMPCGEKEIRMMREARERLAECPQIEVPCEQHLHAGVYSRTILLKKGVAAFGTLIKRTTQLVVCGHVRMNDGANAVVLKGYNVLDCAANRIQCAYALEDTYMTMFFATKAASVEEAEKEFTDEFELLQTRRRK